MFGKKIRDGNEAFLHSALETLLLFPEDDEEGWTQRAHGPLISARSSTFTQEEKIIMIYWIRLGTHTFINSKGGRFNKRYLGGILTKEAIFRVKFTEIFKSIIK